MVFKPWSDVKTPRHLLVEEDEEDISVEQPVPKIAISNPTAVSQLKGTLLIIPSSLKSLEEALKKQYSGKVATSIVITKLYLKTIDSGDYIEEEQLYSADNTNTDEHEEVVSSEIDVVQLTDELSILVVPHYEHDIINYSLISKTLLDSITDENLRILTITPGTLPFNALIGELSSIPFSKFDKLRPPFFISGISGAIVSQSEVSNKQKQVKSLILQSEGVAGFEKVNSDSLYELSRFLQAEFKLSKDFIKNVESFSHSGKNINNFGLYL